MRKALSLIIPVIVIIPFFILTIFYMVIPGFLLRLVGARRTAEKLYRRCGTGIARWILFGLNVKVEVTGRENMPPQGTPMCIIANHQSLMDVVAIVAHCGVTPGFIAKKELMYIPVIASYMRALQCVMLDRKSPKSAIASISQGVDKIKQGVPIVVFPEGTRSRNGQLGSFKAGSLKLATRAKALIVPIVLSGGRKGFEERKSSRRTVMQMHICEPIPTHEMQKNEEHTFTDQVYERLAGDYEALLQRKELGRS